jgi:hypothetical protein
MALLLQVTSCFGIWIFGLYSLQSEATATAEAHKYTTAASTVNAHLGTALDAPDLVKANQILRLHHYWYL